MNFKRFVLLLALVVVPGTLLAQQPGRITGVVTEAGSARPLPGATVSVVGTALGAVAGADGRYAIDGVAPGSHRVRATALGHGSSESTVRVTAGQAAIANFQLAQEAVQLEGVVAVGYGTQRRRDLTGAVASVSTEAMEQRPLTSLDQALQGTVPGVQVTQASSAPGGGISIRIRGAGSITGNSEPLYVIDGLPIENDMDAASPGNGGRGNTVPANPLATLNPNDIESIEILKDASATAIYGARGANGVVIVTTKKGRVGAPQVAFEMYTGTQEVAKRYELLNAQEFAIFANEWAANQDPALPPVFENPAALGEGTDWQDLIFRRAPLRNYQVTVSGGTAGDNPTRYAISGGYYDQEGVVVGSQFERLSIRLNLDQQVGSRLNLGSNLVASRVSTEFVPTDGATNAQAGAVGAALQYQPTLPVRLDDGTYSILGRDGPTDIQPNSPVPNPVSLAEVNDDLGDTRVLGNVFGEYEILDGLEARVSLGGTVSNRFRDTYFPRTTWLGLLNNGRALRGRVEYTSWINENTLTYRPDLGASHALTLLGGYTREAADATRTNIENTEFVSDITQFFDIGAGNRQGGPGVSSGRTRWTMESVLGRVNYALLDRYLLTLTGRADGSSRFGADHRWGFFPSVAAGWRLSDEPFLRDVGAITDLKLRASYGVTGNPSIRPYQSLARLSSEEYSFGGTPVAGYFPSSLGNPELGWESTYQTDIGIDLALLDRVNVTADWYNRRTEDLLLAVDLPIETGFRSALQNAGSIRNTGVELAVGVDVLPVGSSPVSWYTNFNFARNRNEVLDLGPLDEIIAGDISGDFGFRGTRVREGLPLGVFYGYKTDGVLRDSLEAVAYGVTLGNRPLRAGDPRYVDIDGDGVITVDDRTIIGDPTPEFTWGWQNTVRLGAVEVSGLVQGVHGNDVLNLNLIRLANGSPTTNVIAERYRDRWSPTNPDGKYPRMGTSGTNLSSDITTSMLEDGSFVRLSNLSLSYDVPQRGVLGSLSNARVYVTGTNLLTWTEYSGFNPDVSSLGVGNLNRGVDVGAYPLARTIMVGVNVTY